MSELGDQVLALHRQDIRSVHIAHRLGVAQSTVHYHLRKLADSEAVQAKERRRRGPCGGEGETRALVAWMLARGLSRAEVARRLNLAKSTVSYHARQLGEGIDSRFARRFDWELVKAYYEEGHSVRECANLFGFSKGAWQDAVQRGLVTARPAFRPLDEVFTANTRRNRYHLKARLLSSGLKDGRCERCGLSRWRGQPISLALHHINGDRLDNRVENLELLCPNCHSQTDTYGGRKLRLVKEPLSASGTGKDDA